MSPQDPITNQPRPTPRPAGYAHLVERYDLIVVPNHHRSLVAAAAPKQTTSIGTVIEETYSAAYWPGETLGDHLEFALKYDGTNLAILATLFNSINENEILDYIESKPTGKYARRIWFLYEFLTGNKLPLSDLTQGNYVPLLEPTEYYTSNDKRRVRRQRIDQNLLGNAAFCPTIRRTETLHNFEKADLSGKCKQVVSAYTPEVLHRALSYLYTKETKSSFQIENITPDSTRTERFISLLHLAKTADFCHKVLLINIQNYIVDPRFKDTEYRTTQNYIGQTMAWQHERIHCVFPKPDDIQDLMAGLIEAHHRMSNDHASAVIHAAAIAYGFVFLHPFEDGNGRIHRLLIHNILAMTDFTPEGIMFPVSAAMLNDPTEYEKSLEAFSRPLMQLVEHTLDDDGCMTVANDTHIWYRYIDMTAQAESLYRLIERTVETDLVQELTFLANYDKTKQAIQDIVDMPDRLIDLFIKFCLQNNSRLSARKLESHFHMLTRDEVAQMESAVKAGYTDPPPSKATEE